MRPFRKPLLLLSFIGMGFAVPALAQPSSVYPAACEASKVSRGESDRAHTVFLSGKGFLDESNYDKAISYFKDAYSIDCSVHGILPIIATAYERKGDKGEAINALEEYLHRVPAANDRDVVERRIRNLKEQLAQASAAATASSAATPPQPTAPINTGAPTSTSPVPTGTSTGGPPPPGTEWHHSTTPWLVVGVGGVLLAAGAIMFIVGTGDVSSAEETCPVHKSCTSSSAAGTGNTGRTLEGVGLISGIAGLVGVGGGIVWHLTEAPPAPGAASLHVTPAIAPGYAGMGLGGTF